MPKTTSNCLFFHFFFMPHESPSTQMLFNLWSWSIWVSLISTCAVRKVCWRQDTWDPHLCCTNTNQSITNQLLIYKPIRLQSFSTQTSLHFVILMDWPSFLKKVFYHHIFFQLCFKWQPPLTFVIFLFPTWPPKWLSQIDWSKRDEPFSNYAESLRFSFINQCDFRRNLLLHLVLSHQIETENFYTDAMFRMITTEHTIILFLQCFGRWSASANIVRTNRKRAHFLSVSVESSLRLGRGVFRVFFLQCEYKIQHSTLFHRFLLVSRPNRTFASIFCSFVIFYFEKRVLNLTCLQRQFSSFAIKKTAKTCCALKVCVVFVTLLYFGLVVFCLLFPDYRERLSLSDYPFRLRSTENLFGFSLRVSTRHYRRFLFRTLRNSYLLSNLYLPVCWYACRD